MQGVRVFPGAEGFPHMLCDTQSISKSWVLLCTQE